MQIYSSPCAWTGFNTLCWEKGSVWGGGGSFWLLGEGRWGSDQAAAYWKLIHAAFQETVSFMCHINARLAVPVSGVGINLAHFHCHRMNAFAWLECENDLVHHICCVNEFQIKAIKLSSGQSHLCYAKDNTGTFEQLEAESEGLWWCPVTSMRLYCHPTTAAARIPLWWWRPCLRCCYLSDGCSLCVQAREKDLQYILALGV